MTKQQVVDVTDERHIGQRFISAKFFERRVDGHSAIGRQFFSCRRRCRRYASTFHFSYLNHISRITIFICHLPHSNFSQGSSRLQGPQEGHLQEGHQNSHQGPLLPPPHPLPRPQAQVRPPIHPQEEHPSTSSPSSSTPSPPNRP